MKKNMIRLLCLVLALCMGLGLVSCGGAANDDSSTPSSGSGSESASAPEIPEIDFSEGLDDTGYWTGIRALDYVTLPEYKGVELPADKLAVTDEEVEQVKTNLLRPFGTPEKITDAQAKDGDTVYITYEGKVDGEAFEGGSTGDKSVPLTLGSGQYIPGFEEQVVGHKPGETFDLTVTFPEDYSDANGELLPMAGKNAVFTTTIEYIAGEMQYPAFDDAFVADNLKAQYSWTTAAEADADIRDTLAKSKKYSAMMDYIDENIKVSEVPAAMLDVMTKTNIASAKASAAQYGMDFADFLKISGFESEEAFEEKVRTDSEKACHQLLAFQAIAETEKMKISNKDIEKTFGDKKKEIIEHYGKGYVCLNLLNDKVSELLVS
ncbi:trigger factor, partial [gut metagenome]